MINDYHAVRIGKKYREYPDNMVHGLASEVELKMLEAGVKVDEIAVLYESLKRQEPKIHGVTVTDNTELADSAR